MTTATIEIGCLHRSTPEDTPCADCAVHDRCDVCHGPTYRISLIDGSVESLDHRECRLLGEVA